MPQVSQQLIDDHAAVDTVLKQLKTALRQADVEVAHHKLDLFWARLAVHIRAEHLHLFPTILSNIESQASRHSPAPSLDEAQSIVAQLREDHDFFMHELALAVEIMRELVTLPNQLTVLERLTNVTKIVLAVEQRLAEHNEREENYIYFWATTLLSSEEQAKLSRLITAELQKRPSRFSPGAWTSE